MDTDTWGSKKSAGGANDEESIGVENEEGDIGPDGNKIGDSLDDVGTKDLHGTEFGGDVVPAEEATEGTEGASDMHKRSIVGKVTFQKKTKGEVPAPTHWGRVQGKGMPLPGINLPSLCYWMRFLVQVLSPFYWTGWLNIKWFCLEVTWVIYVTWYRLSQLYWLHVIYVTMLHMWQ